MKHHLHRIKFICLLLVSLFAGSSAYAQTLTVGEGTETQNRTPISLDYKRSYTQTIYTAEELATMASKKIDKIAYQYKAKLETNSYLNDYITVYIGTTTSTVFANTTSWINTDELTKSYEGYITTSHSLDAVWTEITLEKPFIYTGTENLVIAVEQNTMRPTEQWPNKYMTGVSFISTTGLGNRTIYTRNDIESTPINITLLPAGTTNNVLPNVRFTYSNLATTGEIFLGTTNLDFSYVEAGQSATKTLTISNYGQSTLNVTGISGLAAPFSASETAFSVPSMGSKDIVITYAPTAAGESTQTITFTHDGAGTGTASLVGNSYAAGSLFESFEGEGIPNYWRTKQGKWTASTSAHLGAKAMTVAGVADTLITPKVSGEVSVFVKQNTSSPTFQLLTSTDLITWTTITPAITLTADYQKATATVAASAYLAIVGENITIDLVQAPQVTYPAKDLLITNWSVPTGLKENTNTTISVTLKNWGQTTESSYTVLLKNAENGAVLATGTAVAIAPLAEETVDITWNPQSDVTAVYVEIELTSDEDLTTNKTAAQTIDVTPFIGVLKVSVNEFKFGFLKTKGEQTITFTIENTGIAPLTITEVDIAAPFTTNIPAELSIAVGEKLDDATITFDPQTAGFYDATLTLTHTGKDGSIVLPLSGELHQDGNLFEDFNGDEFPPVLWRVTGDWTRYTGVQAYEGLSARINNSSTPGILITPLLDVTTGDKLSFYGRYWGTAGSYIDVLTSTDLENWTSIYKVSQEAGTLPNGPYNNYSITLPNTGKYYFAFEGKGDILIDYVSGPKIVYLDHDLLLKSFEVPNSIAVNNTTDITVTILNQGIETEDNYTVKLMNGDEVLAEQAGIEIGSFEEKVITISWTPHIAAGTYDLHAVVVLEEDEDLSNNTSDIKSVMVDAENLAEMQIGEYKSGPITLSYPFSNNYWYSSSELIYSAEELNLESGTSITAVGFPYYKNEYEQTAAVRVWIGNTDLNVISTSTAVDPSTLTLAYENSNYALTPGGTSANPANLWFNFDTSVEYTGENIIVVVELDRLERKTAGEPGTYNNRLNFFSAVEQGGVRVAHYRDDNTAIIGEDGSIVAGRTFTDVANGVFPVTLFKTEAAGIIVTGTLKEEGTETLIEDAKLTLTSGNVLYQTVSEADGTFALEAFQTGTYTLTIEKDEYETKTIEVVVADEDVALGTIELEIPIPSFNITGTLKEEGSETLIGDAQLTLSANGVLLNQTVSEADGTFSLEEILADTYSLVIEKEGYETKIVDFVVVDEDVALGTIELEPIIPLFNITGTLKEEDTETLIGDAQLTLLANGVLLNQTVSEADGTFSLEEVQAGTYSLTIEKSGYKTKTVDVVVINEDVALGTIELEPTVLSLNDIRGFVEVYPNPATSVIYIRGSVANEVSLHTVSGIEVLKEYSVDSIDVNTLPAGIYILQINTDNGIFKTRIVKK